MSQRRRCRGDRGMAMVTGLVLLFAFTAGGVIWLARDTNRSVTNRTAAQSIAFQAARSGAQQIDLDALRRRPGAPIEVDPDLARPAVASTAERLLDAYDLDGRVTGIDVVADRVTVTLEIESAGRIVTGTGSARAQGTP